MSDNIERLELSDPSGRAFMCDDKAGPFVRYHDHLAALERARREGFEEARRQAVAVCRQRAKITERNYLLAVSAGREGVASCRQSDGETLTDLATSLLIMQMPLPKGPTP